MTPERKEQNRISSQKWRDEMTAQGFRQTLVWVKPADCWKLKKFRDKLYPDSIFRSVSGKASAKRRK